MPSGQESDQNNRFDDRFWIGAACAKKVSPCLCAECVDNRAQGRPESLCSRQICRRFSDNGRACRRNPARIHVVFEMFRAFETVC
jgi:hypothetical protein